MSTKLYTNYSVAIAKSNQWPGAYSAARFKACQDEDDEDSLSDSLSIASS